MTNGTTTVVISMATQTMATVDEAAVSHRDLDLVVTVTTARAAMSTAVRVTKPCLAPKLAS